MSIYIVGVVVVAGFTYAAYAYFNVDVANVLSAGGSDLPGTVPALPVYAVGHHYFGDFLLPYTWGTVGNPWINHVYFPDTYTPVLTLVFKVFTVLPYRVALWTYLSLAGIALLSPFVAASRQFRPGFTVVIVGLLGALTYPFLMTLDRGNSQMMLVPLLAGVAFAMARHSWRWAAVWIGLAALLKGYPILLLLLLVPYRQWRICLVAGAACAVTELAAFAVFPGDLTKTIKGFEAAVNTFTPRTPAGLLATNDSLTGCLMNVLQLLGHIGGADARWLTANPWVPGIAYAVVVTPVILARHVIPLWARLLAAFSTTQIVVPESHGYTTGYMLVIAGVFAYAAASDAPPALLLRRDPPVGVIDDPEPLRIVGPTMLIWAGLIAVVLTLLPAPWSTNGGVSSLATIYGPLSLLGFVAIAYVCLFQAQWRRHSAEPS